MKRLLWEPLLHFFLIGVALFVAHRLVSRRSEDASGRILITRGDVEAMTVAFSRTWQRLPTEEELAGLVRDRVREEVYYREALAMGLDRDDTVIRRRLRQKLEFLTDDVAGLTEPTDAELGAYLETHPDAFRVDRRLTLHQLYLDPDKHGDRLDADVARLLAELRREGSGADPASLGDPFLLESRLEAATPAALAAQYGENFAAAVVDLPIGAWQGPVKSGFGVHLVRVEARADGRVPALAEVRDKVRAEWANARRVRANEAYFQRLLERYPVTVEAPEAAPAERALARAR